MKVWDEVSDEGVLISWAGLVVCIIPKREAAYMGFGVIHTSVWL